jgi:hypothetical protein
MTSAPHGMDVVWSSARRSVRLERARRRKARDAKGGDCAARCVLRCRHDTRVGRVVRARGGWMDGRESALARTPFGRRAWALKWVVMRVVDEWFLAYAWVRDLDGVRVCACLRRGR